MKQHPKITCYTQTKQLIKTNHSSHFSGFSMSTNQGLPNSPTNNNNSLINNNIGHSPNNNSPTFNLLCSSPNSNNNVANNDNNNNNRHTINAITMELDSCSDITSNVSVGGGEEQPDPDNIKMFVGQVPKSMDEEQLKRMFEEFGRVHSINVLRDKTTGTSKGELFYNGDFIILNCEKIVKHFRMLRTFNISIPVFNNLKESLKAVR